MDYEGLSDHAKELAIYPQGSGKLVYVLRNRVTWLDLYFENSILAAV